MRSLVFCLLYILSFPLNAQQILIDEDVSDWANPDIFLYEESGDNSRLDIMSLAIADDENYLYFKLEFDREILLQEGNNLLLEISNDNIDFEFNFGEKAGMINQFFAYQSNIGIISSPTVSSRVFEVQLSKTWNYGQNSSYTMEGQYEIALRNRDFNSDQLPDGNEKITYLLKETTSTNIPPYDISRDPETDFRFCTYNVLRDRLFESEARSAYSSIIKAIDPDVIIFQEIYDHTSTQTLNRLLNVFNALDPSANWHAEDRGSDNIILSKYPIIYSRDIAGNGIFVVDRDGVEIMIANIHLPCCERDFEREQQIDQILSFIRKSKNGEENFTLKPNSPLIISGDTNFVGNSDQVRAIMTGDIFDNADDGPDFQIDWDADGLADLKPFTAGRNSMYTWSTQFSSFSPGRLDYVFYSDHSLEALNSFVLDSEWLTVDELSDWNLEWSYTGFASDHLPIIADFKINPIVSTSNPLTSTVKIYPNPASDFIIIDHEHIGDKASLYFCTAQGQTIKKIEQNQFDIRPYPPGTYLIKETFENQTKTTKVIISR